MKIKTLLFAGIALGLTSTASAQIGKGATELGGSITNVQGDDFDLTYIVGNAGYFLTDNFQILASAFLGESGGTTFGSFGPGVSYYFMNANSTFFPYVGASYQLDLSDEGGDDSIEINGGAKFPVNERTTLNAQIALQDDDSGTTIQTSLGISFFF